MHISDVLDLSRAQFAMTAIFHILWPILTISLSAFLGARSKCCGYQDRQRHVLPGTGALLEQAASC